MVVFINEGKVNFFGKMRFRNLIIDCFMWMNVTDGYDAIFLEVLISSEFGELYAQMMIC